MTTPSTRLLPVTAICVFLQNEYHKKVVRQALEGCRHETGNHAKRLKQAITKHIALPGFQYASAKALVTPKFDALCDMVVHNSRSRPQLLEALLLSWVETEPELKSEVCAELKQHELQLQGIRRGITLPAEPGVMAALATLEERLSATSIDDIRLMVTCLSGQLPIEITGNESETEFLDGADEGCDVPTENTANVTHVDQVCESGRALIGAEGAPMQWQKWLSELQEISAQAVEWDNEHVETFVAAVQQLAVQKREERLSSQRQLQQEIENLRIEQAEGIEFHTLDGVEHWDSSRVKLDHAPTLADEVAQLSILLAEEAALRLKQSQQKRREQEQLQPTIDALRTQIDTAYARLDTLLRYNDTPSSDPDSEDQKTVSSSVYETVPELSAQTQQSSNKPFLESEQQADDSVDVRSSPAASIGTLNTNGDQPGTSQETNQENTVFGEAPAELTDGELLTSTGVDLQQKTTVQASTDTDAPIISPSPALTDETDKPEPGEKTTGLSDTLSTDAGAPEPHETRLSSEEVNTELPAIGLERMATVTERLRFEDSDQEWQALHWTLVELDDIAAAYWLAASLSASNRRAPVAPWLLRAVSGGRYVMPGSNRFVDDLLEIAKHEHPNGSEVEQLLGLAAALGPSLFAPESGLSSWLVSPSGLPGLHELVKATSDFASRSIALRPDVLFGAASATQRKEQIGEAARAARVWLTEEAPAQRTKYKRASDVWRKLIGTQGELRSFLSGVIENQRDSLDEVQSNLERWSNQSYVNSRIDEIDAELLGMTRVRPIVGSPRNQLHRWVADACDHAEVWTKLVSYERTLSSSSDWLVEQAMRLRIDWRAALPAAQSTLAELVSPTQSADLIAAGTCLQRAINIVNNLLEPSEAASDGLIAKSAHDLPNVRTLNDAFNTRLLWLPELILEDEGTPQNDQIRAIAPALRDAIAEKRSLHSAFEGWIAREDYRFCQRICDILNNPGELILRWSEELATSRARLTTVVTSTDETIQQAIIDGVIDIDEAARYNALVSSVHSEECLRFIPEHTKLEQIHAEIGAARRRRMDDLMARWQELLPRLQQASLPLTRITTFVEDAFTRDDTRVLEEAIAHLAESFDLGVAVEERLFIAPDTRDILQDFKSQGPSIESMISRPNISPDVIAKEIEEATLGELRLKDVPPPRRQEAAQAYKAWRLLKSSRPDGRYFIASLYKILTYLGLTPAAPQGVQSITVIENGRDWLYSKAVMSSSDMAKPIPQFGSEAKQTYHIIVLWERPGADTIAARLQELRLKLQNIIVIYLGRLTARQRQDVGRTAHSRELTIALLDELLLFFLAQERDTRRRFPTFLRCALPFAYCNPYTPFKAGDVPPEMFFGREAMARELQREQGSCLVYGGRQLGKSALLRHVEREFHHPEREQYAWFEDIKLIGDSRVGQPIETLWQKLRDGFKKMNLLSKRITTDKPEEIERYIQGALEEQPSRRVLVLLDEADNFLDADSAENFRVVERLRALMMSTGRRFKVVFAGLHNVQRFQGIPNQPLAHFGAPICVGPLEADAARRLVRDPLEVLGYRLNAAAVLRVLSYTNYHPGLLQLFCQEVLRKVAARALSGPPPYRVDQADIEAVYRDAQVRERIRERFDWTLALDVRYQAITWRVIWDQLDRHDSYVQAYSPSDLLHMMRGAWPNGFNRVELDRMRGLLDEMCGLGILVRNANGRYRLRSPNLVRLMGPESDIETHLAELFPRQPPQPYVADTYHTLLNDSKPLRYSPLTHAQERALGRQQFGVGLLFATNASGLSIISQSLRVFLPADLPVNLGLDISLNQLVDDGSTIQEALLAQLQANPKAERIVVHYQLKTADAAHLVTTVSEAIEFCRRHQSRNRWMRVILILSPEIAWSWFMLPAEQRETLESQVDAVEWTARWNEIGVQQRLEQHDMIHSPEACSEVYQATGGWPCLLDALFERCSGEDNPRPTARLIQQELERDSSLLRKQFRDALGLDPNSVAYTVLQGIRREGSVPLELVEMFAETLQIERTMVCSSIEFLQRLGYVDGTDVIAIEQTVARVVME